MVLTTLTSKSQITLPKDIRTLLQLEPGDKIAFLPTPDGQVTVTKANKASFAKLRGLLPKPVRAHTVEEMNEAVRDEVSAQHEVSAPHTGAKQHPEQPKHAGA